MDTITEPILARDVGGEHMEDVERGGFWMRVVCFDNGGRTVDRYSIVVDVDPPWGQDDREGPETYTYHASPRPHDPRGVGQTVDGWAIADTDTLIDWADLPERVREAVWGSASHGWLLPTPTGGYVEFMYDFDRTVWIAHFGGGRR